jgi:hypothetical protein
MLRLYGPGRERPARQHVFGFLERYGRRQKWFKRLILVATVTTVVGLVAAVPKGRYLARAATDRARLLAWQAVGVPPGRKDIDAEWSRFRQQGIADACRGFEKVYPEIDPAVRKLMVYAGNDPRTGLLRWGNFHQTLLLPSTVFEPDDHGRAYRLRPRTRSVWLRNVSVRKIPLTFFLVPDGPGLSDAIDGTTAILVEGSTQTTNSWGLRGPEPELTAPVRGIVLGDSFMQGMFLGDDQTPPECLRRFVQKELKTGVSILNTGLLGYSTEQEYHTLREYAERFRPQFVVLSLFANDFGDIYEGLGGRGDWEEGKYWLGEIAQYCGSRGILLVTATAPLEMQITGRRFAGFYPGLISNLLEAAGTQHVDPIEEFVDLHLRLMIDGEGAGRRPTTSPLFNGAIGDQHFSAIGSGAWARAVCRRLVPLLEKQTMDRSS